MRKKVIEIFISDNKVLNVAGVDDLPEDIEIVLWDCKSPEDKTRKTCHIVRRVNDHKNRGDKEDVKS